MKHLLFLLIGLALTASADLAAAKSTSDSGSAMMHSALVDMPKVIDLSRADPTTWPVPSACPRTSPSVKGWRDFEDNRLAAK